MIAVRSYLATLYRSPENQTGTAISVMMQGVDALRPLPHKKHT